MPKEQFDVTGMTCSACSRRIHKTVAALAGVSEVNVNLLKNSMSVVFDDQLFSAQDIAAAVVKTGYGATVRQQGPSRPAATEKPDVFAQELQEMKRRLAISLAFTLPLFYIAMGPMMGLPLPVFLLGPDKALAFAFTQFLLTIPVIFANFKYYRVGFKTLFSGAPNMDSLIAIGSGAAAIFGVYAIYKMSLALGRGDLEIAHHFAANLYFESAAMILTLITLGKFFEARAKGKASEAIAKLMDLTPKTATVLRDGQELSLPLEEVLIGDILVVKAGESVPVDGLITEGLGYIDESALTGESLPLERGPGQAVTGATINQSGHFLMRAARVGDDTTLAQIIRLVDEATSSKAPIARLADRVSGIFVPAVIFIALAAAGIWLSLGYDLEFALSIGIAVLVISCPCALGLATPTAIMVGTGRGAVNGILFKSAQAIETAQAIDTVVLDKTGTITEGRPVITDVLPAPGLSQEELLILAASLEKMSEHPLALALTAEAEKRRLTLAKVEEFTQIPGRGLSGRIDGQRLTAGNAALLKDEGLEPEEILKQGEAMAEDGKTVLYFARGGQALGLVAVADVIKPESRQAVAELKALGLEVIMLTGDNARTAAAIQRQVGLGWVLAEVLPQDKEREIRRFQEEGRKVAMVGDGINDAPALARADVGLAIGAGTDIAIESADVVLMKSDLRDVGTAIELSRAVMRNIRQNLFWSFFYNIVGIPIAAGIFYNLWGLTLSPMIAAAAMSFSSVSVVSNALRLRFFKPRRLVAARPINSPELKSPPAPERKPERSQNMKKIISIEGMSCGHCSRSVEKALSTLPGVSQVSVDLKAKNATLEAADSVSDETLKKAVTDLDFQVTGISAD